MSKKLYYRDKKMWTFLRNTAIEFALFGLFVLVVVIAIPTPAYDSLMEDTIQIESVEYWSSFQGGGSYELYSVDDGHYTISGKYDSVQLVDQAMDGVKAEIKYSQRPLIRDRFIYEMTIGNKTLVSYENNRNVDVAGAVVFCIICTLLGAGVLWAGVSYRKRSHYQKVSPKKNPDNGEP